MLLFTAAGWQLHNWRSLLEDLAAAVEDEVIVGGDLGERDSKLRSKARREEH